MEKRSKERLAAFLMEELLERLGARSDIKSRLGEMSGLPLEQLLQSLLDDFAGIVEKRYLEYAQTKGVATELPPGSSTDLSGASSDQGQHQSIPGSREESVAPQSAPAGEGSQTGTQAPEKSDSFIDITDLFAKLGSFTESKEVEGEKAETSDVVQSEPAKVGHHPAEPAESSGEGGREPGEDGGSREDVDELVDEVAEAEGIESSKHLFEAKRPDRLPYRFDDNDAVYLHAVGTLREGEEPMPEPFLLEEKGINAREFAFGLDYGGLRFYLSKVNLTELNVSKTGVLLLGKQESLQMQGLHEGILNDLRAHGTLLPFEFGTVARQKSELFSRLDQHLEGIKTALRELAETRWWALSLMVLDAKIAQLVGTTKTATDRDIPSKRTSYSSAVQSKAVDIKMLEKILQKEKKIAESVHGVLKEVADRSDIDMMVGLGSGSSENWKPILRASYEVHPNKLQKFYRATTDLQYQYMIFDLLLSLTGKREVYSFARKR